MGGELQLTAAPSDPHDLRPRLDHVTGAQGADELHVGVGREQSFVAVGADARLGRDVTEQPENVRAVNKLPGVVGVGVGDVAAVGDDHAEAGVVAHHATSKLRAARRVTSWSTR